MTLIYTQILKMSRPTIEIKIILNWLKVSNFFHLKICQNLVKGWANFWIKITKISNKFQLPWTLMKWISKIKTKWVVIILLSRMVMKKFKQIEFMKNFIWIEKMKISSNLVLDRKKMKIRWNSWLNPLKMNPKMMRVSSYLAKITLIKINLKIKLRIL